MTAVSIFGQPGSRLIGIHLSYDARGSVEHHFQLAVHSDELPTFVGAPQGVGRRKNVEAAWEPVALG